MNKERFALLCDQILIPRLDTLLTDKLADLDGKLDIMAAELARIGTDTSARGQPAPTS
jgi:hypothetical protein